MLLWTFLKDSTSLLKSQGQSWTAVSFNHAMLTQESHLYVNHKPVTQKLAMKMWRERARERERAIERRGRETGGSEWAPVVTERPCFSRCWWTHLHREEGGSNKQSMRKECGRGRDRGMEGRLNSVLFSALTPCQPFPELVSTLGMWLKRGM